MVAFFLLLISAILTKLISGSGSCIYLEEECDRIRRPIHTLSKEELMLYVDGIQAIRANGKYQDILVDHATHTMIHRGSSFFFWHTYLVWEVETQIRALGGRFKCFALPYYDFSFDAGHETETVILNSVFGGDGNPEHDQCVDGGLWTVEKWPIIEQNLCAETEDFAIGCCLKRAVEPTILLPTAPEIAECMTREEFIPFKGGIVLFHQHVHWFFAQCDLCAMATGYSPDDPIFMPLHSFVAYIRAMWATCHGYNTIAAEDLHEYPDAYTAECGEGYDECGTIELDEAYRFDFLATKKWSITSKFEITPRMLWEFEDWGVVYDIGTFYDESLLADAESGWCAPEIFEDDEQKWFLKKKEKQKEGLQKKQDLNQDGPAGPKGPPAGPKEELDPPAGPETAAVAVSVDKNTNSQQSTFTYLFVALLFVVVLAFIGCLSRLRNMKKGHEYTLLSTGNHDVVTYGANA